MSSRITVGCSKTNLLKIRQFVNKILEARKIQELEAHKIVLAVDEVCANLIIHSNDCNPNHKIDITVQFADGNKIVFLIKDKGLSFDYKLYQEPNMDEIVNSGRKGGVGLMLVKRIMDKVEFSKDKNCNICRLTKNIRS